MAYVMIRNFSVKYLTRVYKMYTVRYYNDVALQNHSLTWYTKRRKAKRCKCEMMVNVGYCRGSGVSYEIRMQEKVSH